MKGVIKRACDRLTVTEKQRTRENWKERDREDAGEREGGRERDSNSDTESL